MRVITGEAGEGEQIKPSTPFSCRPVVQILGLVSVGTLFGLIGMGILATDHSIGGIAIGAVTAVGGAALAYRGLRVGVRADGRGITHRSIERPRVIPWCQIQTIAAESQNDGSPMPTGTVELLLNDGSTHALNGMATFTFTKRSVAAIETRCQELRNLYEQHRAWCTTC
jgi:hypothetical protein